MAIDTRDKRASVINFDRSGRVFPNPDGSLANANDRVHVGTKYAGITGEGAGVTKKVPWHLFFRRVI
jgi:hypothetical protein